MGQSPEELRREIEQTRSDLGGTLDAIGDRVSPGRIMERRKNRFRDGVGSVRDRVMGPADHAMSTLTSVPGRAGEMGSGVAGSVGEHASGMADTVRSAPSAARAGAQGSPLLAGGLAFGVGFLAAVIFPGSEKEAQLAQTVKEKAQPLIEEGQAIGKEAAANLKEPAQEAAESLKSTAQDAAATVKAEGQQHAAEVSQSTTESQQRVQEHQARPDTSL